MSIASIVSQIQQETSIIEVGGVEVDGTVVIDQNAMIPQTQVTGLTSTLAQIQAAIGQSSYSSDLNMQSHLIKNLASPVDSTDAANKAYVDSAVSGVNLSGYMKTDGTSAPSADISLNSHKLTNVTSPVASTDAANKAYVDTTAANYIKRDGTSTIVADIPMSNKKITGLAACTLSADAANKAYVDSAVSSIDFSVYVRKDGSGLTTNPSLGGYHWINCSDPIDPYDACTKHYCDNTYISISPTTTTVYNLSLAAGPDRPYYMSVSPHFLVSQNIAQTNAYGMYISAGSSSIPANSSITNGYGLFVERPTFGTNKWAAYFNGDAYVNGNIVGTTTPTLSTHLCNKNYVDSAVSGINLSGYMKTDGTSAPSANISLNSHKLTNVATPTLSTDAATKGYVDSITPTIDLSAYLRIDGTQLYTHPSFNYYRLTYVGDPYDAQDVCTKHYCDLNYIRVSPTTDSIYRLDLSPGLDRERYVDIFPQFSVTGNITQSFAYGLRINTATVNLPSGASITNGISLYVDAPNVGTNQYTAYLNGNSVNTGRLQIGTIPTADLTVMLDARNSGNTSGYQNVARLSVTNSADGTNFSRMYMGQYSTNVMFIEAADQSNTKGTLLLQPYGGSVKLGTALDANSNRIQNVYSPIAGGDAANKTYTDTAVSNVQGQITSLASAITASFSFPVFIGRANIHSANNFAGLQANFVPLAPWYANTNVSIYNTSNSSAHIQTPNANNEWIQYDFSGIPANGRYSIRFSVEYGFDRAIMDVKQVKGGQSAGIGQTEIAVGMDLYMPSGMKSERHHELFFDIATYPTYTTCGIRFICNGRNALNTGASGGYYILLGATMELWRWS